MATPGRPISRARSISTGPFGRRSAVAAWCSSARSSTRRAPCWTGARLPGHGSRGRAVGLRVPFRRDVHSGGQRRTAARGYEPPAGNRPVACSQAALEKSRRVQPHTDLTPKRVCRRPEKRGTCRPAVKPHRALLAVADTCCPAAKAQPRQKSSPADIVSRGHGKGPRHVLPTRTTLSP